MGIKSNMFPSAGSTSAAPYAADPKPTQADRDQEYVRQQEARRRQEAAPPPARQQHAPAPAQQQHRQAPEPASYPDDHGVGEAPPDSGNGGDLPYPETFGDLPAGRHTFLCCVESILHWQDGPVVALRVRVGPERGREFKWRQTPDEATRANEKRHVGWKRDLFGAYAAGGWTHEPDPSREWAGWPRSAAGVLTPPYADFFVVDVDGVDVPVLLAVTVKVDSKRDGGVFWPVVVGVRRHAIDGVLVQAPMPRKLTPWIAARHRWTGVSDSISVKATEKRDGYTIDCVKVTWDQIQRGVGGMLGLKDCTP